MLRAKLINTTNQMVATNFKDCVGEFYIKDGMVFIKNEKPKSPHSQIHRTSLVEDYFIKDENNLYVYTLNSVYQYQILEGTHNQFHSTFSNINNAHELKIIQDMRKLKYHIYMGQSIDGWVGPIYLPKEMDWDEATDYIRKNNIPVGLDVNSTVVRLTSPIKS